MASAGQVTAPALQALLDDKALAGSWVLDGARSTIGLRSKSMWGMAPVKGAFGQVAGLGTVAADGAVTGTITVGAASIDTKNKKRDVHLRSADFFDSGKYPDIVFTVTAITPSGPGLTVSGQLTVRDQTRPVSFDAAVSAADAAGVSLDAEIPFNRADFGLTWNQLGMASLHNILAIHAVFSRGAEAAG
jgi:polyisoprenoid-binding protein YceI